MKLFLLVCSVLIAYGAVAPDCMSDSCISLDGADWDLELPGIMKLKGTVPGDLTTDLQRAKIVPDPLTDNNFQNNSLWDTPGWTYTKEFSMPSDFASYADILLVLDGIKKVANVSLNGQQVATIVDQFQRNFFSVKSILKPTNKLQIVFTAEKTSRYMACSGGWDWAPYGLDTHSIWKSVYIAKVSTVAVEEIVTQAWYQGPYPKSRLQDGQTDWTLQVGGWYWCPTAGSYPMEVEIAGGPKVTKTFQLNVGSNYVEQNITNFKPNLWWPMGHGKQSLYTVSVTLGGYSFVKRVGFRTFSLVTGNDTDPSWYNKDLEGTLDFTMMFRVNGIPIYARGANVVPMQELEGRYPEGHIPTVQMVKYSAAAGMNLLRIWGGGIFQFSEFYDTCDQLGIIVYHDMMYAQRGHAPQDAPTAVNVAELLYNIRQLVHHPSIVIWDGCNECGGRGGAADLVIPTVSQADKTRAVWGSCPSGGWKTGTDRWYVRPLGDKFALGSGRFESHGPYMHGDGFKTVNSHATLTPFNPNLPATYTTTTEAGPQFSGKFKSEFGCTVMSSFESMTSTLASTHWGLHTAPFPNRNYCVDNIIVSYFGPQDFSKVGEAPFKKQLYQSMLGQALFIKSELEAFRAGNWWGTVIWQLNDIWPTGGWASLEFETNRWKPLHHFLRAGIFQDELASCNNNGQCYVRSDSSYSKTVEVKIDTVNFATGKVSNVLTKDFNFTPNKDFTHQRMFTMCAKDAGNNQCTPWTSVTDTTANILQISVTDKASSEVVSSNVIPLCNLKDMKLPKVDITAKLNSVQGYEAKIDLNIVGGTGVYVVLTTQAVGFFHENAMLVTGPTTVTFEAWHKMDSKKLMSTLRVENLQEYL